MTFFVENIYRRLHDIIISVTKGNSIKNFLPFLIYISLIISSRNSFGSFHKHVEEIRKVYSVNKEVVIINFWASWCKPCLKEFESLKALHENLGTKIEILAFCTDEEDTDKQISKIRKKYNLQFKLINDGKSEWSDKFKVETLPNTFIYHKNDLIFESNEETNFLSKEVVNKIEKYLK